MTIYEHDETAVGELDKRWIPVLNGAIFCSPSCGAKCTKSAYDEALRMSNEIALELGENWMPQVFENLGWYWKVTKGSMEVRYSDVRYNATMQFELYQNYCFSENDLEPRKAVQKVRDKLQDVISKLERQYTSSALDPISIS